MEHFDFELSSIINGQLILDDESKFYSKVELELLKIVIEEHDFCPQKMNKGEVLRLSAHIENMRKEKYEKLQNIDEKLLLSIKYGLSFRLNKLSESLSINSTVSIVHKD
ncbi:hypothetical protein [Pseudoalteromonas luteoviolacea]|uniref:Uncharacterized protein n=1 Tax=Pseudoalteromonas luteoviolacea S4060-1 TaxID=1365257 RepID=A0A167KUY1_9GAMM|nr:hypothetical protein [Pseudoalteromonas luteoviolacea]KZN63317.1 hypothetical protein N478_03445 [Pseudoalteromonas luteoviolacea S4060-1]